MQRGCPAPQRGSTRRRWAAPGAPRERPGRNPRGGRPHQVGRARSLPDRDGLRARSSCPGPDCGRPDLRGQGTTVVRPAHRPPCRPRRAARLHPPGRRGRPARGPARRTLLARALTLVLRKLDNVPGIVTAGLPTVGLRVPDHPVALALIRAAGVPIAAPSANRFGRVSPTRSSHVVRGLGSRVRLVLDGGPCRVGVESTVVLLAAGRAALLRPGGLAAEAIEAEIGPLEVPVPGTPGSPALAPGASGAHYAPGARLEIVDPFGPGAARRLRARPDERLGSWRRRPPGPRPPGPRAARSRRCGSSRPTAIR